MGTSAKLLYHPGFISILRLQRMFDLTSVFVGLIKLIANRNLFCRASTHAISASKVGGSGEIGIMKKRYFNRSFIIKETIPWQLLSWARFGGWRHNARHDIFYTTNAWNFLTIPSRIFACLGCSKIAMMVVVLCRMAVQ